MGKHNINGGVSKAGNVVKARVHAKKVFEEGTSTPVLDTITFITDTSTNETFVLELRPQSPEFDVVTLADVTPDVTVTDLNEGRITGKKLTFTSVANLSFKAEAKLTPVGLAPDEGESTSAARSLEGDSRGDGDGDSEGEGDGDGDGDGEDQGDGDGDDPPIGLPIRIRVVIVHPTGLPLTSEAAAPEDRQAARPIDESLR